MKGQGKYDSLATMARHIAMAEGLIVVVVDGIAGNGCSAQLSEKVDPRVVIEILRGLASQIAKDCGVEEN